MWRLYARLNVLRGDIDKEIDCLKKRVKWLLLLQLLLSSLPLIAVIQQCRVLQSPGWERSAERLRVVWKASLDLLQRLQAEGSPRSVLAAKMHLRNILARSKTGSEAANIDLEAEEHYQKLVTLAGELGL